MNPETKEFRWEPLAPETTPGWSALWRLVTRFEREKVAPWIALRNTIGIVVPLIAGAVVGAAPLAMVGSMGAMNVSFSDGSDPYVMRAQRMLIATVMGAAAVVLGGLTGWNDPLTITVCVLWSFGAGMLVAVDSGAADIGVLTLVMVLIFSAQPVSPSDAIHTGLLALGGGLLQTALSITLWPLRRYEPERRILSSLYYELGRMTVSPMLPTIAPPGGVAAADARDRLSSIWLARTIQGKRYLSLSVQGERIRLSLLMLGRIRNRWRREVSVSAGVSILDDCLLATSRILQAIARSLERGGAVQGADPEWLKTLHDASERLRQTDPRGWPAQTAQVAEEVRHQIDALAGQLRAAIDLAFSSSTSGRAAFEREQAQRPWWLRLGGTYSTLRANLNRNSAAFRHAVRMAACVLAGELASQAVGGKRSYWLPMTIVIVLKPDFGTTVSRGVLRVVGTFAGLVIATALFHLITPPPLIEIALIGVLAFLLRCFGPANYGLFVTAISAMVVLLFALAGQAPAEVIAERGWNTLIGGVIALGVYVLWPTWERSQVNETLGTLLDSYRDYFRTVRIAYVEIDSSFDRELDRRRMQAQLARSNAEASAERLLAEPGIRPHRARLLISILATSHRVANAVMALEAGLARSRPVPARPSFSRFANHVEITLHSLAGTLRGSQLLRSDLPDLREDHNHLVQSGIALTERHALVDEETDRITNSINTLSEQILEWTQEVDPITNPKSSHPGSAPESTSQTPPARPS